MILVDANLLIYAFASGMPQHDQSRDWLEAQLHGPRRVALPWESLVAFLRITTNPRIFSRPASGPESAEQVDAWLRNPFTWVPTPGEGHWETYRGYLQDKSVHSGLVHDAHLAALAACNGLTLCSSDGDFARFDGLRWENPLAQR